MKFLIHQRVILLLILLLGCASWSTKKETDTEIGTYLMMGDYQQAFQKIENYKKTRVYLNKDRVLYYLNKGMVLHYLHDYQQSNQSLQDADRTMEDLFTRSISRGLLSVMANDNVLDYAGEVYDNLYVNIFKALNYLGLNDYQGAYVEIRRVNDKLRALDIKYGEWVDQLNDADTTGIKIEKKAVNFYENALANYLSYLIFRTEREEDNARISFEKIRQAWDLHPEVYDFPQPSFLQQPPQYQGDFLSVLAFVGTVPQKYPTGREITTFENFILVTDVSGNSEKMVLFWPGLQEGWHFKFAFPEMQEKPSVVSRIELFLSGSRVSELEMLEDMGKVATYTFESKKNIIYMKTLIRTLVKGVASQQAKEKIKKETKTEDSFVWRNLINLGIDAIMDATENPDLRSWTSLPQRCYVGEIRLPTGQYDIAIHYFDQNELLLKTDTYSNYGIKPGLNLLESTFLN